MASTGNAVLPHGRLLVPHFRIPARHRRTRHLAGARSAGADKTGSGGFGSVDGKYFWQIATTIAVFGCGASAAT